VPRASILAGQAERHLLADQYAHLVRGVEKLRGEQLDATLGIVEPILFRQPETLDEELLRCRRANGFRIVLVVAAAA